MYYTATAKWENYGKVYFLDDDKTIMIHTSEKLPIRKDKELSWTSEVTNKEGFFYIYNTFIDEDWQRLDFLPKENFSINVAFILKESFKAGGRYIIPAEDIFIIITGKDFDGMESSRIVAGAFIILEFVQVGKVAKLVKVGTKLATTTAKIGQKILIDHTKEAEKEALMEFGTQLMVNLLIEIYKPQNKGANISILIQKAYKKIDWKDIAIITTHGIKVKSKITDEQINCIYEVYKNFLFENHLPNVFPIQFESMFLVLPQPINFHQAKHLLPVKYSMFGFQNGMKNAFIVLKTNQFYLESENNIIK